MSNTDEGKQVRGERLVARVLDATIAELARVGSRSLSIDEVASLAEVNKTTIYRRWATPDDLARAAVERLVDVSLDLEDTGELRADLASFLGAAQGAFALPDVQWLIRSHFDDAIPAALARLTREVEDRRRAEVEIILGRAVARGELSELADRDLLFELVFSALLSLFLFGHDRADEASLDRIVETLLDGALHTRETAGQSSHSRLRVQPSKATNLLLSRRTQLR